MKEKEIQYMDEVRLIQDWEGYEKGTVGRVSHSPGWRETSVEFSTDENEHDTYVSDAYVPNELLERVSNLRKFQNIEDIWDEEVQPISEAEMLQALHKSWENPSVKRDIYVVAIYTHSCNQADGWDEYEDDEYEDQDIQPWETYITTVYYVQNGVVQRGESSSHAGPIYSDVHDIDTTTRGRSAHSIAGMIRNSDMGGTVEKVRQLYEELGII